MFDSDHKWKEKEWERYANELVSTDHNLRSECYQRIPDKNGDCGLEGVADTGDGYQSYADQDSKTLEARTTKQKDKIYKDLRKLEEFKDFWTEYFDGKKLKRWTLLVPNLEDKEVVKYAKKRAKELKKLGLPFIDDSFDAFVKTDIDYPAAKMLSRDPRLPSGDGAPITDAEIAEWKKTKPVFVAMIDEKLKKAMPNASEASRHEYRDRLLRWHLQSENFLKYLARHFPPQWKSLDELVTATGESLKSEEPFDTRGASKRLTETRREFYNTLKDEMKYIGLTDREDVSWGTLALWLGICPLDFPEVSNA